MVYLIKKLNSASLVRISGLLVALKNRMELEADAKHSDPEAQRDIRENAAEARRLAVDCMDAHLDMMHIEMAVEEGLKRYPENAKLRSITIFVDGTGRIILDAVSQ